MPFDNPAIQQPDRYGPFKYWTSLAQWVSEYQTSLVFKWSKRGRIPSGLVFERQLNTGQMEAFLFSYVLVR